MKRLLRALGWALTLACIGCNVRPLTQLVVVTETSLRVPSELDQIEIDITSPSGSMGHRMAAISSSTNLPATLGVVHRSGPLGPIHIRVRARLRDSVIVTRDAEVTLQEGRTLRVDLSLDARCRSVSCSDNQSCAGGACRSVSIAPSELIVFDGTLPSTPDAGSPDATTPVTCSPSCGNPSHATGLCVAGTCRLLCESNRSDCNGRYEDGCETDTRSTNSDCGACGRACDGGERCRSSVCD
jgi:hypothetical protein